MINKKHSYTKNVLIELFLIMGVAYFHFIKNHSMSGLCPRVVNRIYSGYSNELKGMGLKRVYKYCENCGYSVRLYPARPYMIRLRYQSNTILIFSQGKIRTIGSGFSTVIQA